MEHSSLILGTPWECLLFFVLDIQGLNAVLTLIFTFFVIFNLAIERPLHPS